MTITYFSYKIINRFNTQTFFCKCFIESRQQGRFAGFSLYLSNNGDISGSTLCYKDGPQLPPLDFTTTCTESGRYLIFYNERLDAVIYPEGYEFETDYIELCEVYIQGNDFRYICIVIIGNDDTSFYKHTLILHLCNYYPLFDTKFIHSKWAL